MLILLLLASTVFADGFEPAQALSLDSVTHLEAPLKERRRAAARMAPAPSTELPYDSSKDNGIGWHHKTEQFMAHPFERYTAALRKLDTTLGVEYTRKVIKSTSDFNKAMRATAHVAAGGWGLELRAQASFERDVSMSSKDVLFMLHASKELGFEGWALSDLPPMKESAKALLCDNGMFTAKKFEDTYGTYYVRGIRKATALDVYVKIKTSTSNSSNKISTSLDVSWSGVGASASAGASFANEMSKSTEKSSVTVSATAYGVSRDWVPMANIDNLDQIIDEYEQVSSQGSGIALVLSRYDDHPDYITLKNECRVTFDTLKRMEIWQDKYVDVAVEAKLFSDELLSMTYDECAVQLARDALALFKEIVATPEEELDSDGYFYFLKKLHTIQSKWNAEDSKCFSSAYVGCFLDDTSRDLDHYRGEVKSVEECREKCPNHQYFAVQQTDYVAAPECALGYTAKIGNIGCQRGVRENWRGTPGDEDLPNMPVTVKSVDDCSKKCSKHPDCEYFASTTEKCWLKKNFERVEKSSSGKTTSGWKCPNLGKVNGVGGGKKVKHCDECGKLCNGQKKCRSYECSPTELKCNLNYLANPTEGPWKDFMFCTRDVFPATETWVKHEDAECKMYKKEHGDDDLDTPRMRKIKDISRTQCKKECLKSQDKYGRPCIAIEMDTHSSDPNKKDDCNLMYNCDYTNDWGGGHTYKLDFHGTCPRPPKGCLVSHDLYQNIDCDGDGILDHVCTAPGVHDRRWVVLSSEGCGAWVEDNKGKCVNEPEPPKPKHECWCGSEYQTSDVYRKLPDAHCGDLGSPWRNKVFENLEWTGNSCMDGDVRLRAYPKGTIEVYQHGKWRPLCGHKFWDNDYGADTVCRLLGYSSGTVDKSEMTFDEDAWEVGVCTRDLSLSPFGTHCAYHGPQKAWCTAGNAIGVRASCKGRRTGGPVYNC